MKILHDIHNHTKYCGHATGEISEYIERARRLGLEEIGFSDHLPLVTHRDPFLTMDVSELPKYHSDLDEARASNKDMSIKTGIEADYIEGKADQIRELLEQYPYDYVIGSVHFIKGWGFDDERSKDQWEESDVEAVYKHYYKILQDSARTGLYDIIGHVDLVKKFGYRPKSDLSFLVKETAKVFNECGVCIEINSSGLRKPVKEIYPSLEVLKIYSVGKVPIVFGSDSHTPEDVGADFDAARDLALAAGYTEYLTLRKRQVEKIVKL